MTVHPTAPRIAQVHVQEHRNLVDALVALTPVLKAVVMDAHLHAEAVAHQDVLLLVVAVALAVAKDRVEPVALAAVCMVA